MNFLLTPYRGLFGGSKGTVRKATTTKKWASKSIINRSADAGDGNDTPDESTPSADGGKDYKKLYEQQLKSYSTLQATHTTLQANHKAAKDTIATLQGEIGTLNTGHSEATAKASELETALQTVKNETKAMKVALRRKEMILDPKFRDLVDFEHGNLLLLDLSKAVKEDGTVDDAVIESALTTFQTGVKAIMANAGANQQQQQQQQQQEQLEEGRTPPPPPPANTPAGANKLQTLQAEMNKHAASGNKAEYDRVQSLFLIEKAKGVVPSA